VSKRFEVHKPAHAVSFCESGKLFFFVLGDAALQIVGDSNIENAGCARENIDVIDHEGVILSCGRGLCHSERSEESRLDFSFSMFDGTFAKAKTKGAPSEWSAL
jgi:hypothetical protein